MTEQKKKERHLQMENDAAVYVLEFRTSSAIQLPGYLALASKSALPHYANSPHMAADTP